MEKVLGRLPGEGAIGPRVRAAEEAMASGRPGFAHVDWRMLLY